MRFWYDTEFLEDGSTIDLISIGIVAESGQSYYAVNYDAPWKRVEAHDWLRENALPFVDSADMRPLPVIAQQVCKFLQKDSLNRHDNELWAYYGAYDHHVVLCQLWGSMMQLPNGVPMYTNELMQLWNAAGQPEKPPQFFNQHNALADARWNYELWKVCMSERES